MCTELGRLSQGYRSTTGTDTIQFMDHEMIDNWMVSVPFVDPYPWARRPNSVHIDSYQTGFVTSSFSNVLYFVIVLPVMG